MWYECQLDSTHSKNYFVNVNHNSSKSNAKTTNFAEYFLALNHLSTVRHIYLQSHSVPVQYFHYISFYVNIYFRDLTKRKYHIIMVSSWYYKKSKITKNPKHRGKF